MNRNILFHSWLSFLIEFLILFVSLQITLTNAATRRQKLQNNAKDGIDCSLNGVYDTLNRKCECDSGWKGETCSILSLAPAPPPKNPSKGVVPGVAVPDVPTWGGGAAFEDGKWHLLVGSLAINKHNNSVAGYPCNSKIIRVVSKGPDPLGPYTVAETVFPRSSWEPGCKRAPNTCLYSVGQG